MQARDSRPLDALQDSLLAAAEIGANRLLTYDEDALAGCRELQGHCIEIQVSDIGFSAYCHPGNWGIRLARTPPARDVDARISGRLMALVSLALDDDKLSTSMQERVSFHGDVQLAQKLQRILGGLDVDWEEMLSRHTGDLLGFQIHEGLRRIRGRIRQSAESLLQTSSEYLREEARLSPTLTEFDDLQARVTDLRNDVARAEARLERLLQRIDSR